MSNTPTMLTDVAVNLESMLTRVELIDVSKISVPTVTTTVVTEVESITLKDIMFSDLIYTELPTNVCHAKRKKTIIRIRSIMGIPISRINLDKLRSIASRIGMKGHRKGKKEVICDLIVNWVSEKSNEIVVETFAEETIKCVINRRRYLNVIFSDTVRQLMATRGASLDKDELTCGLKTDQLLHTT